MNTFVATSIVLACLGPFFVYLTDCTNRHVIPRAYSIEPNKSHPFRMYLMSPGDVMKTEPADTYFTQLTKQCGELNAQRVLDHFEYCCIPLDTVINEVNFNITEAGGDLKVIENGFKTYCQNWHLMKGCVETMIYSLTPCLGKKLYDTLVEIKNSVYAVLTYACEEDRWPELVGNKDINCKGHPLDNVYKCMNRKAIYQLFYVISIWWNPLKIRFNKSFCKYLRTVEICALSTLSMCKDQDHAFRNFTASAFNAIHNATSCRHYTF